jgi:hypothetical protein
MAFLYGRRDFRQEKHEVYEIGKDRLSSLMYLMFLLSIK